MVTLDSETTAQALMRIRKKKLAAPSVEKRRVVCQEGIFVTTRGQARGHTALVLNTAARKLYAVYKKESLHVVSPSHLHRKSIIPRLNGNF